jgi:hypothetical protein
MEVEYKSDIRKKFCVLLVRCRTETGRQSERP